MLDALTDPAHGVIASLDEVKAVGHRVAHGGEFFPESCIVTEDVKTKIRSLFEIAPLHNPANLEGVLSIEKVLPGVKQVTVFDTSFHQSIPAVNYMYALPHAYYEKYRVRKYGFHGTSHKYVAKVGAELAGLDFHNSRIITCHIGNGGSVTAILNGKSYDTSMGFSPLDGLVMGTRCGQVDASAITFIGEKEGMSYAELNTMMNKKSGVQGLTDISSDMRDIDRAYDEGNPRAILARDMYYGRIKKFIGEYAAEMGGVDMIIFTGGVGENSCEMREAVCTGLEFMGVKFDPAANKGARGVDKYPRGGGFESQGSHHRHQRGAGDRHGHLQSGKITSASRPHAISPSRGRFLGWGRACKRRRPAATTADSIEAKQQSIYQF